MFNVSPLSGQELTILVDPVIFRENRESIHFTKVSYPNYIFNSFSGDFIKHI